MSIWALVILFFLVAVGTGVILGVGRWVDRYDVKEGMPGFADETGGAHDDDSGGK